MLRLGSPGSGSGERQKRFAALLALSAYILFVRIWGGIAEGLPFVPSKGDERLFLMNACP